jgi:hypothetical protein
LKDVARPSFFLRNIIKIKLENIMATPIKDTPVLTGRDARNFDMWLKENSGKKVTNDNYKKIMASPSKFRLINAM